MKSIFVYASLQAFLITSSFAATLPNAIDLKATYCTEIISTLIQTDINEDLPENVKSALIKNREINTSNLRRLSLYLIPRIEHLDILPLLAAKSSAKEDMKQAVLDEKRCLQKSGCFEPQSQALERIRTCNNLSFLPF